MDYLQKLNPHVLDKNVSFDPKYHKYNIDGDTTFTSVTTWVSSHFPKFDTEKVINNIMASPKWESSEYYGMTKQEIKDEWSNRGIESRNAGTALHDDIERFYNKLPVKNKSSEWKYFQKFARKIDGKLTPYRTEMRIFDKEMRMAGSVDMLYTDDNGDLVMYDWKRSNKTHKENNNNNDNRATTECLNHLHNCEVWKYSLQLNTYRYIIEKNYG